MAAGDLTPADRFEIDKAIRAAEESSRCEFSVFVGRAQGEPRAFASRLHAAAVAPDRSILVSVDPVGHTIEVVTGAEVRRTLTDHQVDLAILAMRSAFAEGDLVDGLVRGINQLADNARAQQTLHARA